MAGELKPCASCGGVGSTEPGGVFDGACFWWAFCDSCGMCVGCPGTELRARSLWNELQPATAARGATVDHPAHYGGEGVYEAINVIEAWGLGFHAGNAVKYLARAGKKPGASEVEDLRKARWYVGRLIERAEAREGGE